MAITKYKVIKKNLEAVINYAKNGEKTENGILVTGINCLPDIAYNQMTLTKKSFHKEDGRLRLSYNPIFFTWFFHIHSIEPRI